MLFLSKKYKDIPLYNTLISLTNTFSSELPGILIPKYFGLAITGHYGMASRIIRTPLGLIGQSVAEVFFNKASEISNNQPENFYSFIKKTYINLLKISILIFPLIFVASFFFEFILGKGWTDAGLYSRLLLPWLFLGFLNSPVSSVIVLFNKQKAMVVYDILFLIFRFLALYLGYQIFRDIVITLILYSTVGTIFNLFLIYYFLKISKNYKLRK